MLVYIYIYIFIYVYLYSHISFANILSIHLLVTHYPVLISCTYNHTYLPTYQHIYPPTLCVLLLKLERAWGFSFIHTYYISLSIHICIQSHRKRMFKILVWCVTRERRWKKGGGWANDDSNYILFVRWWFMHEFIICM